MAYNMGDIIGKDGSVIRATIPGQSRTTANCIMIAPNG